MMRYAVKKRLSIFDYVDYRFFLKEYYFEQKRSNRAFSYRYFAAKAKVSASVLKDITEGRRRLTPAIMKKYALAMQLSAKETEYFEALVLFVNSKTNSGKNECFNRMMHLRANCSIKYLDEGQYEFFRNWRHSAIRELITLPDFKEDYEWIGRKCAPPITAAQARKSIELMQALGIIKRAASGKLVVTDAIISSDYELNSFIMRNFHDEMIGLAREALDRFTPAQREISSLTLGVSNRCYERIKERIRIFKSELLKMAVDDTSDSETVCQCNFQLFPLVKSPGTDGRNAQP
jgi:uncharacterized protein (TIGR02147 family)